jgi:uncharacterized protein YodC (DUF2158 family)
MADDFKPGDVVRMKSGGPAMTVEYIGKQHMGSSTNAAQCSWFQMEKGNQVRHKEWFELVALIKAE